MNDLLIIKKEDISEPARVGILLKETALSLSQNKQKIEEIKKKNPLKGMFSYKTLAAALLEQNQSISSFMSILQSILLLQVNNLEALSIVMESLNKSETTDDENESEYIAIAKECLAQAIATAQKNNANEKRLDLIENELALEIEQAGRNQEWLARLQKQMKKQEKRFRILLGVCIGMGMLYMLFSVLAFLL